MKSLLDLIKLEVSALRDLLLKAREESLKIKLAVSAKKEADISRLRAAKKYVAQILTVINTK